ncbi:MAG: hypothetical protein K6G42_02675 [Lachnospiraceae bacterium]|nr:hypothetical protein [Lachnospiraceae bacterium]
MGRVIGYDLTDLSCQVSIGVETEDKEEVRSVALFVGSEKYVIPVAACIDPEGEISYGEEAVSASEKGGKLLTNLMSNAVAGKHEEVDGEVYDYTELLSGYIKRTIHMSSVISPLSSVERVVITMPDITEDNVKTVEKAAAFIEDEGMTFRIIGYPESFFYYAMNQDPELTKNKVALFDYDGEVVRSMLLYTRVDTRPHLCMVERRDFDMKMKDDMCFLEVARAVLDAEIVSAVYLSGEGFEGGWLSKSVSYLCERRRRVFQGRNLYTKGACYAGIDDRDGNPTLESCRFFDDEKLVSNIGLHMLRDGQEIYVPLLEAGINWYDARGKCEFYLGEDKEIRLKIESYFTKDVRYSVLRCDSFPGRPVRCTRVRLEVSMKDASCILCKVYDLGFGDIYRSAGDTAVAEVLI